MHSVIRYSTTEAKLTCRSSTPGARRSPVCSPWAIALAGLTPTAEMGGTHLGGGFVLGWEAGRAAATGEYAEPHTAATFGQAVEKKRGVDLSMPIISVDAEQQRDSRL
jgi:hypothetical protein